MFSVLLGHELTVLRQAHWDDVREAVAKKVPVFIDVVSPTGDDIDSLRKIFHFHPTNLEDCTYFCENPKIEEHKHYIFTVVHNSVFNEKKDVYENFEVHIFLGENYIVAVHDVELEAVHEAVRRIRNARQNEEFGCSYIYYAILDSIVDSYFPIVNYWSGKIDEVEEYIFDSKTGEDTINRITGIRKGLLALKRISMPQREVIYKISHTDVDFIREEMRPYLKDVFDHMAKIYTMIEDQRDLLSDLMDAHFSRNSARLNEVMQRLTIISTVFMPMTFIVGVYGMNFKYMPELEWKYGYFTILFLMLLTVVGLVVYFKSKKWF